jgi:glutaminase
MKFLDILKEIEQELKNYPSIGNVTTTIPELANVRADKFGMHLTTIDQEDVGIEIAKNDSPFKVYLKH